MISRALTPYVLAAVLAAWGVSAWKAYDLGHTRAERAQEAARVKMQGDLAAAGEMASRKAAALAAAQAENDDLTRRLNDAAISDSGACVFPDRRVQRLLDGWAGR